jgi:hypothetical protein
VRGPGEEKSPLLLGREDQIRVIERFDDDSHPLASGRR